MKSPNKLPRLRRIRGGSAGSPGRRLLSGLFALLIFVSTLLLPPTAAFAADAQEVKTVKVAMDDSELFFVKNPQGNPIGGYGFEYVQAIAAYAGWRVEYIPFGGLSGCLSALLKGEADLFYDISYTEDRAKLLRYPDMPMGTEEYYLYCLAENTEIRSGDYSSYAGKKVGLSAGASQNAVLAQWCADNGIEMTFVEFESTLDKAAALQSGEIDIDYEVGMLAQENFSALAKISGSDYYLVANNSRADLIADINRACLQIEEIDPFFTAHLTEKYFVRSALNRNLSERELEWVSGHTSLRVGYLNSFMPYSDTDENGEADGVIRDVMPVLLGNLGLKEQLGVEYYGFDSSGEMYAELNAGNIDVVFPAYEGFGFGIEHGVSITSSVINVSADLAYKGTYSGSTTAIIAVNRNDAVQEYLTRVSFPDAEIVFFDSIDGCIEAVSDGVVGSTLINGLRATKLLSKKAYDNLIAQRMGESFGLSFAVSEGNAALLAILNRAIVSMDKYYTLNCAFHYNGSGGSDSLSDFIQNHRNLLMTGLIVLLLLILLVAVTIAVLMSRNRRRLAEANAAKTHFLFNMSHDIRTPMNAILGFTDIAKKNIGNPAKISDCLDKIQQAGTLLLSLINSVLEMSRIESGKAELDEKPTRVEYSFVNIDATMQELAKKKNIDLSFTVENIEDHLIFADIDRANRVFINLISNAVKYTEPGGRVRVCCEQLGRPDAEHGLYRYTFEDNGIGISEEFQRHLFDEFSREKPSTTSGVQGFGLGLSVARTFVELMHGTIECSSRLGEGTVFTVVLPFRLQTDEVNAHYVDPISRETLDIVPLSESKKKFSLEGKRILLVEDNEMNREIAAFVLDEENMIVEEAEDGQKAVELLREKGPTYYDAVLMDIQMPVMNGYEATKAIRAMYPDAKLPIIALSANAFAEDKAASLAIGMNDHIAKPIRANELYSALSAIIEAQS